MGIVFAASSRNIDFFPLTTQIHVYDVFPARSVLLSRGPSLNTLSPTKEHRNMWLWVQA